MPQELSPSFDTWTSMFLLVSSFGFFLSIILSLHKRSRAHNLPIILLILGFSFILLQYVLFWTRYRSIYPHLYFFDAVWYLSFGPLVYHYITRFYDKTFKIGWYHYVPALLSFVLHAIYYVKSNGFQNIQDYNNENLFYFYWSIKSPWLAALSLIIYIVIIKDFIALYQGKQTSEFEILRTKWIRLLINLFLVFTISYISYYTLVRFSFFNVAWDYGISFSMSLAIYGMGYMVYKEPSIFNGELLANLFIKNSNQNELTEATKNEFHQQLLSYIAKEKPYLDNNLRLVHLADKIGFSSHTLSKLINEKAQKNFNQFINDYRLEEAKKMLLEDPETSIKTIYFDVGFNNKATFNTAFKNKFNCTPSEFKKQNMVVQDK